MIKKIQTTVSLVDRLFSYDLNVSFLDVFDDTGERMFTLTNPRKDVDIASLIKVYFKGLDRGLHRGGVQERQRMQKGFATLLGYTLEQKP